MVTASSLASNLEVDVIAVGSEMGASCAALAAQAQGLKTDILEKSGKFGGGTTYAYGIVWVGDNHLEPSMESRVPAKTPILICVILPPVMRSKATSGLTSTRRLKPSGFSVTMWGSPSMRFRAFPITSKAWRQVHGAKAVICRLGPLRRSHWASGKHTLGRLRRSPTGRHLRRSPLGEAGRGLKGGTGSLSESEWTTIYAHLEPDSPGTS